MFNDNLVADANDMEPKGGELDLDGEDELARQRRMEQEVLDDQTSTFQRRSDEALVANRQRDSTVDSYTDYTSDDFGTTPIARTPSVLSSSGSSGPPEDLLTTVKGLEGYNPNAYGDYKQTSIGYGTRAKPGETSISQSDAEARLKSELATHHQRVIDHASKHGYQFTPGQINALTSFDFNTGRLEQLTANGTRKPEEIAAKIPEYNKAGGKVNKGLVNRRRKEQTIFTQG
jgi:GH24 family phage-related lysozyme (muramidase)